MTPREPYGDKPMTSAERVKRSRWVNSVENTAFRLLELLDEAPEQLPRKPGIPTELITKLQPYITDDTAPNSLPAANGPRVLKLGNGNQHRNKQLAMSYISKHFPGSKILGKGTINIPDWGNCHISAYSHPRGAMISTPYREDQSYGGVAWHNNDHILLFRDIGDGKCVIYINEIEPLFDHRTIGQHGVLWKKISELAEYNEVLPSEEVLKSLGQ